MIWTSQRNLNKVRDLVHKNGEWKALQNQRGAFKFCNYHRVGELEMNKLLDFVQKFNECEGVSYFGRM